MVRRVLWIIIGVLCVLYGFMVLATGSGTLFFAIWLILGAGFFILSVCAKKGIWKALPKKVKAILLSLLAAIVVGFLIVEAFILSGFRYRPKEDVDYLIVLGAQVREGGPSVVLKYRLDAAYEYLKDHGHTKCIVTGGQGWNEPFPEAEGMKTYLADKGIEESRILTESESNNTLENIANSLQFIEPQTDSVAIVTNNFHVFRGCAIARRAGIRDVTGLPADSAKLYLPNNLLREAFGVLKDFVQRNI